MKKLILKYAPLSAASLILVGLTNLAHAASWGH